MGGAATAFDHGPERSGDELAGVRRALADAFDTLRAEQGATAGAYGGVVRALAAAIAVRDGYPASHADDVHALAAAVGRELGLEGAPLAEVQAAALLHDVGKLGVPLRVLHAAGELDDDEWELVRRHPTFGEHVLRPLPGLAGVATAVRHGHERWDGRGYPDGLAGEEIPLASRVALACGAYGALRCDRPYRAALAHDAAVRELRRWAGTQFDPKVVETLLVVVGRGGTPPVAADPAVVGRLVVPDGLADPGLVEAAARALVEAVSAAALPSGVDAAPALGLARRQSPAGPRSLGDAQAAG